jgi:hypothetical protein
MPKKDKKRKDKTQAPAQQRLKVRLVDAHARAKDGDRGGKDQPAGVKQVHQPVQRDKALKKIDKLEPLVVVSKKVRPPLSSDLLRSINEMSKRKRLRSPPPPQTARPSHAPMATIDTWVGEMNVPIKYLLMPLPQICLQICVQICLQFQTVPICCKQLQSVANSFEQFQTVAICCKQFQTVLICCK